MKNWFKNNSESLTLKLMGWMGASLVIFGYYLNANEFLSSWIIWMLGNILVGIYSIYKKAYSTAAMSFIIMGMNIYGYLRWLS
jgi:hypothetical protein|tara:strand:+ start:424 stop:672 length:249 start_codon:yes stop_codon:yes gene_type:complete